MAGVISLVRGRLAELVPAPGERCGTSPVRGAPRVLAAGVRQVRGRTAAVVALDGGSVEVDLATPHGRRIFAYGFCEPAARAMRTLLGRGDVMIDAGANIGLYTVVAAARVGAEGRVIACEPSPATMALLRGNVVRNAFGWVELHEAAVAEAPGRLELEVFEAGSGVSSFAPAQAGGRRVEVTVRTLDELAGAHHVKLVKLDVEGAELRALRGATGLLERARPDFIVELEPEHLARQGASLADVQALFEAASYEAFAIGADGLEPIRGPWQRPAGDPNVVVRPCAS